MILGQFVCFILISILVLYLICRRSYILAPIICSFIVRGAIQICYDGDVDDACV